MNKRTILSGIIGVLWVMNVLIPFIGNEMTYFELFLEAMDDDKGSDTLKFIAMSPTGILLILTGLHIAEPRSEFITRNYLAYASIAGFILYLLICVIGYGSLQLLTGVGDVFSGKETEVGILDIGFKTLSYPILFLSYVLVHKYMSYDMPENFQTAYRNNPDIPSRTIEDYDENEFV